MNRSKLGRWGEDLVAKALGYRRVSFSGGVWPHVEDLVKTTVRGVNTGAGGIEKYQLKYLAQVKTTDAVGTSTGFFHEWMKLLTHATTEGAKPRWFDVVRLNNEALIFERKLVKVVQLGIGGDE